MGGLFRDAFAESAGSAGRRPGGLFPEAKRSLSLLGHLGLLGGGRADFAGKRSLSLLGLLGGGRADFAGKRSLRLLGLLGGGRADFSGKRSLSLLGLLRLDLSGSVESAGRGPGSSSSSIPVAVYQQ